MKKIWIVLVSIAATACADLSQRSQHAPIQVSDKVIVGEWKCASIDEGIETKEVYNFNADHTYSNNASLSMSAESITGEPKDSKDILSFYGKDKGTWAILNGGKILQIKSDKMPPLELGENHSEEAQLMLAVLNKVMPTMMASVNYTSTIEIKNMDKNSMMLNDITEVLGDKSGILSSCTR